MTPKKTACCDECGNYLESKILSYCVELLWSFFSRLRLVHSIIGVIACCRFFFSVQYIHLIEPIYGCGTYNT